MYNYIIMVIEAYLVLRLQV